MDTLQNAKKLIQENFAFLENIGYSIKQDNPNPTSIELIDIESIDIEYINTLKNRSVSISYSKSKVYDSIQYAFVVAIIRQPYINATTDFFSLWIYLDSIGNNFSTKLINHYSEEDADNILKKIVDAIKTHAMGIIAGTDWKEGFYAKW